MTYLTKTSPEANQYRFYRMHIEPGLFGEWGLVREWGRIGRAGRLRTDWYATEGDAEIAQTQLAEQKFKRGYVSRSSL